MFRGRVTSDLLYILLKLRWTRLTRLTMREMDLRPCQAVEINVGKSTYAGIARMHS